MKLQAQHIFSFIVSYLLSANLLYAQDVKFRPPLKGVQGKDYWIVFYCDHDKSEGLKDVKCGTKTYDGHTGTDFLIRNFKTMDSGVYVYAVADGKVFEATDSLFDGNKAWIDNTYGNVLGILHGSRYYTYYGHLKKYSLLVKKGDSVRAGQAIAQVGSSGRSALPHLHLQVHDFTGKIIDPFQGDCSDIIRNHFWEEEPEYDTAVYAIDAGFMPYIPARDTISERPDSRDTFYINTDSLICYWIQVHGLKKKDLTRIEWYMPNGKLWFRYDLVWKHNWQFDYTWFYLKMPRIKGEWHVKYYVNNSLVSQLPFYITKKNR